MNWAQELKPAAHYAPQLSPSRLQGYPSEYRESRAGVGDQRTESLIRNSAGRKKNIARSWVLPRGEGSFSRKPLVYTFKPLWWPLWSRVLSRPFQPKLSASPTLLPNSPH